MAYKIQILKPSEQELREIAEHDALVLRLKTDREKQAEEDRKLHAVNQAGIFVQQSQEEVGYPETVRLIQESQAETNARDAKSLWAHREELARRNGR